MMKTQNRKKGSAMITTILVMLLVCVLVTIMLTLSMYSQSMSKTAERLATRQNRLDMLTDLFLEYNHVPNENFGYSINVYYFEDGSSTMTVRQKETSVLCDMIVEQRDGEIIARYYDAPYFHTESVTNRTIGIHNEQDNNPHLKLTIPKSDLPSGNTFYVYGKIKLERATRSGGTPRAYVNLSVNGGHQTTVMTLNGNTNGWVNLQTADGKPLTVKNPSSSLDFIFGLDKTKGELTVCDLVVVDSQNKVRYSLSNDTFLNGAGDVRHINKNTSFYAASNYKWSANYNTTYKYTTAFPIVTRDPGSYMPKRMLQVDQYNYICDGETSLCLYKYGIKQANGGAGGFFYITGRVRVNITGKAEVCDKAGDYPVGQFHDVHSQYDRSPDPNITDYYTSTYPSGVSTSQSLSFYTTGSWIPLLCQDGSYYKFYVPNDCEKLGEDYLKFTLWAAQGTFEIADIRIYKTTQNGTPNPATDTCVYNMETDSSLTNTSYNNCPLGDERQISDYWRLHWFNYSKNPNYIGKVDQDGQIGEWKLHSVVNPLTVNHDKAKDYKLPVFANKVGSTYQPNAG